MGRETEWGGMSFLVGGEMGKQWNRLNARLTLRGGGRVGALLRSEVKCDGWASSLHPGRGRAVVPTEWALWPPGRALVPPPSQPGPAQSPQEVPRSQVGRLEEQRSLMYLAGRGGPFAHPTVLAVSASFSSWRFTFYLIAFIAGMAVIVDVSGDY